MRTNPTARYRHSVKSGKRDGASLHRQNVSIPATPERLARIEQMIAESEARGHTAAAAAQRETAAQVRAALKGGN